MKFIKCVIMDVLIILFTILIMLSVIYPKTAIVIGVDEIENVVTVEDFNGDLWQFYGTEDYEKDDIVAMIMFNSFSKSIYDDKIMTVYYNGNLERG